MSADRAALGRELGEVALVTVAAGGAAAVLTHPLVWRMGHVGRLNSGDGQFSVWNVAWVARALVERPRSLFDANIFFPHHTTLAYSEANLGAGLLAVPFYTLTRNPYFALNAVTLVAFVLSTLGAYLLVRHLTGHRGAAFPAALMFAFCPYMFAHLAHIQLLMTAGLPFSLLAFHRLVERPTVARGIALGAVMGAQGLSCGYYGVFVGLMVAVAVLLMATLRRSWTDWRYWRSVGLAAATSLAGIVPFLVPYLALERQDGFGRTIQESWSADWRAYLASPARAYEWMLGFLGHWNEVLFPGALAIVLGGAGIWIGLRSREPRVAGPGPASTSGEPLDAVRPREVVWVYGSLAVLAAWVSFGPPAGLYSLLYHTLPVFWLIRAPARFGVVVTLAIAVLAGLALSRLLPRCKRPGLAALLVAVAVAAEVAPIPLDWREAPTVPAAHRRLAGLPPWPVLELPFFYRKIDFHQHAYYMLLSTSHWQPLINGYSDFIPQDFVDNAVPLSSFPTAESFVILKSLRARYVVFHLDLYDYRNRERMLERLAEFQAYLKPLVREGDVWLYEIVRWP